jgi:hypothetical protein
MIYGSKGWAIFEKVMLWRMQLPKAEAPEDWH